jgi:hypothetical protein
MWQRVAKRLTGCHGPSAPWPARPFGYAQGRQNAARKKKPATPVGMTGYERARENQEKSRKAVAFDRKNPPFAKKREGWGTLKYDWPAALDCKQGHLKLAATLFGGGDA